MPLQIAAGAGLEAIVYGIFGVLMSDNKLVIRPYNHEDIGTAILRDVRFRGRSFNIRLERKKFTVFENEKPMASRYYGESFVIQY